MIINNQRIAALVKPQYSAGQIGEIASFLQQKGTLDFTPLPNGLFPAGVFDKSKSYTGYSHIWVRDNIHIAHAHYVVGHVSVATKTVRTLMQYFIKHRRRFLDIVEGRADAADPMNRPHIRFDGNTLEEVDEKWAHAQNDALGYFLWLFCKLVNDGKLTPSGEELDTLELFPHYFQAIQFWQDEDSGHWEETRKISASSIGVVVAGLQEFARLTVDAANGAVAPDFLYSLTRKGQESLREILPAECVQPDSAKHRPYDGALLFLIYPLNVVEGQMADAILANVVDHLQGDFGIRRYLGDSYWAPDYKKKLKPASRTVDFSDDLSGRDQLLPAIGQEAQWCIFDPIISCIYGSRFSTTARASDLAKQTEYLNRSLGQITAEDLAKIPAFRCPELYYLEDGRYVPNDHVPLLWTQANLMLSLKLMQESSALAVQAERTGKI